MMARSMVDCEVLMSGKWPQCAISTMSKDGYTNFTRTASSSKYNNDMSRIAVPVRPCVQRQFQLLLFGLQSVVCSDLVVLHRYRCHVTTDLLGRPANGENTATTGKISGSTALDDRRTKQQLQLLQLPRKPEEVWLISELETSRRCSRVKRMSGKRCTKRTDHGAWQTGARPHRWMRIGQGNWKRCARRRVTFEVLGE